MADYAPRICIDFDGVLHSYHSGWKGADAIPDPPTPGAVRFVEEMLDAGWEIVVCSTRAETREGLVAIERWLVEHDFPLCGHRGGWGWVTHGKPPALVYLDDRALRFNGPGDWPDLSTVERAAAPWTKDPQ